MTSVAEEYRYNRLAWKEFNEAIEMQKVVILPTGSTEQHGHHLPLDVDAFLCEAVCLEVGQRAPSYTVPGTEVSGAERAPNNQLTGSVASG